MPSAVSKGIRNHCSKIVHAAHFVGLWCHVVLEIDQTTCDPASVISDWHALYVAFVQGFAAIKIQQMVRMKMAKNNLHHRQCQFKREQERRGSTTIQQKMRYCLALKAVQQRKLDIAQQERERIQQVERDKITALREIEKEKKRVAAAAAKERRDAKLAKQAEEKARRGW